MRGYKPVEIEIHIDGVRRRLRVQVDEQTKDTGTVVSLLDRLFERLKLDMINEGIF